MARFNALRRPRTIWRGLGQGGTRPPIPRRGRRGAESATETFAAIKLFVDNWRWQDVPFYLRTGKRLARFVSEISIRFRAVPHQTFPPEAVLDWQPARLVIRIQPDEGIVLRFQAKQPGPQMRLRLVDMRFSYEDTFHKASPDAYETILWDAMANDTTLIYAHRPGGGRLGAADADSRRVGVCPAQRFPQLCLRHLGTGGRRSAHRSRRPHLAATNRRAFAGKPEHRRWHARLLTRE